LGMYNWECVLQCDDICTMYNKFLQVVRSHISTCIPTKTVTLGPRDPDFITPLVKSLLNKRRKLRKKGKSAEADELAVKINGLICEYRKKCLANLSEATPKELWAAVNAQSGKPPKDCLQLDPNACNQFFADIATDHSYCVEDVASYCIPLDYIKADLCPLWDYTTEKYLRSLHTSSGFDDLPCWIFNKCSFELAGVVTSIFKRSFATGTVPKQWKNAVVTPVPKKTNPSSLSEYRPISITPILSRLAEKIVVREWLRPSLPNDLITDQYAFRPTGSTTCALVAFTHNIARLLESNSYVRCLLIDFSKAFDVVCHTILLSKLSKLNLPPAIFNWIIDFLTGRTQVCKTPDGIFSTLLSITRSIIQGSGLGPTLWIVMASDLHPLSVINVLLKYADDVNLLAPENTDIQLHEEFSHIQTWADNNGMIINISKTKEIVFHRPHPTKFVLPQSLEGIERVSTAKLLGVIFQDSFSFVTHVDNILKVCSQRIFLLKQLRDQGMPLTQLHLVFQALILSRIAYAFPAWGPLLNEELRQKINAFLKRSWRYGFSRNVCDSQVMLDSAMWTLFNKMQSPNHCLFHLLPPVRNNIDSVRSRGHNFQLIEYKYKFYRQSFIVHCLFKFL